jgi:hypothetical protein
MSPRSKAPSRLPAIPTARAREWEPPGHATLSLSGPPPYRHRDPSFHHTPPSVLDLPAHPNAAPVRAMGAGPDFFVNARDAPGQAGGTPETPGEIPGRSWRAPGDGSGVRGRMAGKAQGCVRGAALKRRGHRTERQRSLGNRSATRVAPRGSDGVHSLFSSTG